MSSLVGRLLTANDRPGHEARLAERFDRAAVARLLAASRTPVVAVEVRDQPRAAALCAALDETGAQSANAGTLVATVATVFMLTTVAERRPEFAPECTALATALSNVAHPPVVLRMRERILDVRDEARVMAILNVTPDSFYDRVDTVAEALKGAEASANAGAALLDIGGQSYAHWNPRIAALQERDRVLPVVEAIRAARIDVALSIDTTRASVAEAALAAGAHLINDCSGLSDPALAETVARYDAALVVMHLKGELNVRRAGTYTYADALAEVVEFLYARTEFARAAGVAADAIVIDPGLEFGKEPATDLEILERFGELTALGYPILFAASRKSFIGRLFNRPAAELLAPSLAAAGIGIAAGARLLRVHDVAETVALARMYAAIRPERRANAVFAARMPGTPQAAAGNFTPPAAV